MNDTPIPGPRPSASIAARAPKLLPEDEKRMHALQVAYKGKTPAELARCPVELVHTIDGKPIAAKFVSGAPHPDTGLPRYADFDRSMISALRDANCLDRKWRLHKPAGNEYVLIHRMHKGRFLTLEDIYRMATGIIVGADEAVIVKDGNLADLRRCNLTHAPRKGGRAAQTPPLRWEKTPLDPATYDLAKAKQRELDEREAVRTEIRWEDFIYGRHADQSQIAIKFVSGPESHEDTGFRRYQILDAEVAKRIEQEQDADDPWGWSLSFAKKPRKDGSKRPSLIVSRTDSPQAARVIFELGNPGTIIPPGHVVSTRDGNPLNLCLDNLTLRRSDYKGTRH